MGDTEGVVNWFSGVTHTITEKFPAWSQVGLAVMAGGIAGSIYLWPLSHNSKWEMGLAALCSFLILVGFVWAIAALAGRGPFRVPVPPPPPPQPPEDTSQDGEAGVRQTGGTATHEDLTVEGYGTGIDHQGGELRTKRSRIEREGGAKEP
jgi:hypothetical protein